MKSCRDAPSGIFRTYAPTCSDPLQSSQLTHDEDFLWGCQEVRTVLHHPQAFPQMAIGPVRMIFNMLDETGETTALVSQP